MNSVFNAPEIYVKSYGSLMNTPVWQDDALFKLFHFCLYEASTIEFTWKKIHIMPGMLRISYRSMAAQLAWSLGKTVRKVRELVSLGMVSLWVECGVTLLQVNDWQQYGIPDMPNRFRLPDWAIDAVCVLPTNASGDQSRPAGVLTVDTGCVQNEYTTDHSVSTVGTACTHDEYTHDLMVDTPEALNTPSSGPEAVNNYIYINNSIDKKEHNSQNCGDVLSESKDFEKLWLAYPTARRSRYEEAAALFSKAIRDGATAQEILTAFAHDSATSQWLIEDGRYIPGIANWLKKESWKHIDPFKKTEEGEMWKTR